MSAFVAAVDFGGTHLRAALVDQQGRILSQVKQETLAESGPAAVMDRIATAVELVSRELPDGGRLAAIGTIAPGPADPTTGVVLRAPNLEGWENIPLSAELERRSGVPVRIGNDANLAALAEHRFGAGQGLDHLVYLTISTGIGSGFIVDGRLLLGARGYAGEAGHVQLIPDGPVCGCGNRGCVEALASGPNIVREVEARLRRGLSSRLAAIDRPLTARDVVEMAREGDPLAVAVISRAGYFVGMLVASLAHLFSPERVVIGGGVSNAGALLFNAIRGSAAERVMPAYRDSFDIVPAALGDDVGLLGAAALAFDSLAEPA